MFDKAWSTCARLSGQGLVSYVRFSFSWAGHTVLTVLSVYLALAVLQRAVHCAWTYIDAGGYERVADAWHQNIAKFWVQRAAAQLAMCPGVFADVLRPFSVALCVRVC